MLSCRYIGSGFPGDRKQRSRKSTRSFYDLWSRNEAHEFTIEVLRTLGFRGEIEAAGYDQDNPDCFLRLLHDLPDPDFSSEASLPFSLIQARALILKNDDFESGIDKEEVAWQSFLVSEEQCRLTNRRLGSDAFKRHPIHARVMHYAAQYISRVLGPCPSINDLDLEFGPGAATSCTKKTSARWKLSSPLTASNSLFRVQRPVTETMPAWLLGKPWIPSLGALEFVPKSFKTYRSIIIEPLLNGIIQKGFGSYMKRKMFHAGIDLYDQSLNRERARVGSLEPSRFATIDLSRASDTLAYSLVMDLLPWDWFMALDSARSGIISYRGSSIVLEKFSSMGNGFTFELESLIFKALARGIALAHDIDDNSSVFGDDIIASRDHAILITNYFPDYGFTINSEKTFIDGNFRESCGGDYAFGVDVRPFFLKGSRTGGRWTYHNCVVFHNHLQRKPWFDPNGEIRRLLLAKIPDRYQNWGPDGYGDGHLVSLAPLRTYARPYGREKGYEGFKIKTIVAVPFEDTTPVSGDALLPAYLAGKGPTLNPYAIRLPKGGRMASRVRDIYVT